MVMRVSELKIMGYIPPTPSREGWLGSNLVWLSIIHARYENIKIFKRFLWKQEDWVRPPFQNKFLGKKQIASTWVRFKSTHEMTYRREFFQKSALEVLATTVGTARWPLRCLVRPALPPVPSLMKGWFVHCTSPNCNIFQHQSRVYQPYNV